MKTERTKNATKNIIFGIILKLYQIAVPFLMRTTMIYTLGVNYLGLNSLFTSILQVLNLAELGVGSAMVFSMYKPIAEDDDKKLCALIRLYKIYYRIIGSIILFAGLIICPFIRYLIKSDLPPDINIYVLYIINLLATVFSYWLFAYKSSLLQAYQRSDIISKITISINTIMYLLQFVALIIFKNYYYYIILTLFGQICINIVTAIVAKKMFPNIKTEGKLDKTEIKNINQRIKDLFTTKIGAVVMTSADTIIISAFLGLTQLAVYQNYYYVINSVYGIVLVIFNSVIAGIGNSFETETIEKNYNDLKKFTFIISWINCVCTTCILVLYQPFMKLWVGEEYMLNNSYVILFCIYFYILVLPMIWATIKDAVGLWHSDRFRQLIGAIFNLTLNIILVQVIGLYGVILSTLLSYMLVTMPWLVHNLFKYVYKRSILEYLKKLLLYVVICLLSCCITGLICTYLIKINGILELIIKAIIAFGISNAIQYAIYNKFDEFMQVKQLMNQIAKTLLKGKIKEKNENK